MTTHVFNLNIAAHDVLRYYQGRIRSVRAKTYDGRVVEFDLNVVLPFGTKSGISGTFALSVDENAKFLKIERVDSADL